MGDLTSGHLSNAKRFAERCDQQSLRQSIFKPDRMVRSAFVAGTREMISLSAAVTTAKWDDPQHLLAAAAKEPYERGSDALQTE
jgi:hypothetical protein